jgi:hypothetical protein
LKVVHFNIFSAFEVSSQFTLKKLNILSFGVKLFSENQPIVLQKRFRNYLF